MRLRLGMKHMLLCMVDSSVDSWPDSAIGHGEAQKKLVEKPQSWHAKRLPAVDGSCNWVPLCSSQLQPAGGSPDWPSHLMQVVYELRQVFNGVDVMMGWWRDERDTSLAPSQVGNVR